MSKRTFIPAARKLFTAIAILLIATGCIPLCYKCTQGEYSGLQKRFVASRTNDPGTLHVVMIHGMRTHLPGYGNTLATNLASSLRLRFVSSIETNLLSPANGITNFLRELTFANGKTNIHFYELTWSSETTPLKSKAFKYDNRLAPRRLWLNKMLKSDILDDGFGDAALYSNREFKTNMQGPIEQTFRIVSDYLKPEDSIAIVSSSLGSKMTFDTFDKISGETDLDRFAGHTTDIIMLANQIPLLSLGDTTTNSIRTNGVGKISMQGFFEKAHRHHELRARQQGEQLIDKGEGELRGTQTFTVNVLAATDLNDILSYPLRTDNLPVPIVSTNKVQIKLNLVNVFSHNAWAFPFLAERPDYAHSHYDQNKWLIKQIVFGSHSHGKKPCVPEAETTEEKTERKTRLEKRF